LPELVQNQKTGFLFRPGDKNDLKNKIVALYSNSCLVRTIGLQARLFAEKEFSAKKHYENLLKIYKKAKNKKLESQNFQLINTIINL